MEFKDLFDSLPDILALFVPGFLFLKTYFYFGSKKSDSFQGTAVVSVVISYIIRLLLSFLSNVPHLAFLSSSLAAIFLAFVGSLLLVKLKTLGILKKGLQWIGKVSDTDNIWREIFDCNKGSRIRCFTRFYHQDVMIDGDVRFFDLCKDGECSIVLESYTITYKNGNNYTPKDQGCSPLLYINTRNVHGLEVMHGKSGSPPS